MKKISNNKIIIIERRYNILIAITIIAMFILVIGLFNVQILKHNYYKDKLQELTNNIVYGESAPRGRIYDRNGKIIVDNKTVKVIYYKKKSGVTTSDEINTSYKLAQILDLNYNTTDLMIKKFWIKNNYDAAYNLITKNERLLLEERKITSQDIENYKLERIDVSKINYSDLDKKAAYIYNLMNTGYSFTKKSIKKENVTDLEYAKVAESLNEMPGVEVKMDWERVYPYGDVFRTILGSIVI